MTAHAIGVDPDPAADEHGPDRPVLEAQDGGDRRPAAASEQDLLAVRVPVVRRVDLDLADRGVAGRCAVQPRAGERDLGVAGPAAAVDPSADRDAVDPRGGSAPDDERREGRERQTGPTDPDPVGPACAGDGAVIRAVWPTEQAAWGPRRRPRTGPEPVLDSRRLGRRGPAPDRAPEPVLERQWTARPS